MSGLFDLSGKVALVTGAAKGIGRETTLTLARCGATVVATDIDHAGVEATGAAVTQAGGRGMALKHDVTSEADWQTAIDRTREHYRRLDVLVNNAGIMITKPFQMTTMDDFRLIHRINVEGVFIGIQCGAPLMIDTARSHATHPSIVNISSIYGQVAGPAHAAYCSSKGAVRLLTKAIAIELAQSGTGIRANSIHPGPVNTELAINSLRSSVQLGAIPSVEAGQRQITAASPMGRWAEPADIARVIAFLASDASQFMNGSELTIDGGYSII